MSLSLPFPLSLKSRKTYPRVRTKIKNLPGQCFSAVRASAHGPKGLGFDFWSRAHTWVSGSIPSPIWGPYGRQAIDVSFSLSVSSPFLPLSLKLNGKKYHLVRINTQKKNRRKKFAKYIYTEWPDYYDHPISTSLGHSIEGKRWPNEVLMGWS
uniref:Uncharacterized protein n=1 Tax=Myotis myotis TaxID=51298 RepID=A0A7J7VIE4_MYOMY|nr:hypothetical protein mMyoMyo1_008248 [Myotis myotis]